MKTLPNFEKNTLNYSEHLLLSILINILPTKLTIATMTCLIKKSLLDSLKLWLNFEFWLFMLILLKTNEELISFRTHQDRLVKKLRLAWINSVPNANPHLKDVYIPEHNKKYSIKAVSSQELHVPLPNQKNYFLLVLC